MDGLSASDMAEVMRHECSGPAPLDAQQVAEEQADEWCSIWRVGADNDGAISMIEAIDDPAVPPELLMAELLYSLTSFPCDTGLGWDKVHPRAIRRASAKWLLALLKLLIRCEAEGKWPQVIALVIICLLPKPE